MKPIYVTYTRILHSGDTMRFAVQCENMEQAQEVKKDLSSRRNVKNIRYNKSGRDLPVEAMVFFYAEFMYNN